MDYRRLWVVIDRRKAVYRVKSKPIISSAFDLQIKPVFEKLNETSDIRDFEIPTLNNEPIKEAYKRMYLMTSMDFAILERGKLKTKAVSEDEVFNAVLQAEILNYININAGETISAVGDTSLLLLKNLIKKLVPQILDEGASGGGAVTMLRDQIQSAWHEMKYFRTERITRTEVNRAANWGSIKGAQSLDYEQNKVWISAFAEDSRISHEQANGQKIDLKESFTVNGEQLQYPGDPAGSAGNTINCLCSTYMEIK